MRQLRKPSTLPPLSTAICAFGGLRAKPSRTYNLLQELRQLAHRLRGPTATVFYSTREVAEFFGVDRKMAGQVFAELESEGLLVRLRATGTMLTPVRAQPRFPVRGVVGVPIWQWAYCHITEWRRFCVALDEQLARHHFVADLIMFQDQTEQDSFLNRLLRHHLDYVLWFKPLPQVRSLLASLQDRGIEVAVVTDADLAWPYRDYRLKSDQAVLRVLRDWRQAGIRHIVVHGQHPQSNKILLPQTGLPFTEVHIAGPSALAEHVAQLARRPHTGVFFADATQASVASHSHGPAFAELLRQNRVLLAGGIDNHRDIFTGCRADFIVFDWPKIAGRIAVELATGAVRQHRVPVICDARARIRADAKNFSEAF